MNSSANGKANANREPNSSLARMRRSLGLPLREKNEKNIAAHNEWRRRHGMPTVNEEKAVLRAAENAEEAAHTEKELQAIINRTEMPLTRKFIDIITNYFKVQIEADKILLILAELDKRGINSSLPTYSNYVKKYQTTAVIGGKFKQQFDAYLNIGEQKEYREKYIGGRSSIPILEKMYLSETSGLIPTEQWVRNEKINDNFYKLSEDEIKEAEERKRHIPAQFMFPAYISSFMQNRQTMDMFFKRFPTAPNVAQNNVADFNLQLPIFLESQARVQVKGEKFDSLYEDNFMHILDKLYRAELSGTMKSNIEYVLEEEENAVKRAIKGMVKPMGQNIVRENQNNHFGGTRRRRRNRKSTRRHRRK